MAQVKVSEEENRRGKLQNRVNQEYIVHKMYVQRSIRWRATACNWVVRETGIQGMEVCTRKNDYTHPAVKVKERRRKERYRAGAGQKRLPSISF